MDWYVHSSGLDQENPPKLTTEQVVALITAKTIGQNAQVMRSDDPNRSWIKITDTEFAKTFASLKQLLSQQQAAAKAEQAAAKAEQSTIKAAASAKRQSERSAAQAQRKKQLADAVDTAEVAAKEVSQSISKRIDTFKAHPKLKQYCILNQIFVLAACGASFVIPKPIAIIAVLAGVISIQAVYHAGRSIFSMSSTNASTQAKRHFQYLLVILPSTAYVTARTIAFTLDNTSIEHLTLATTALNICLLVWVMLGVLVTSLFFGIVYRAKFDD